MVNTLVLMRNQADILTNHVIANALEKQLEAADTSPQEGHTT